MPGKTALVFPGMGPSSFEAVGKFLVLDPFARRRIAEADKALGYSLLDRFYAAGSDYSEPTQVAFLVNSMALADRVAAEDGLRPDFCTGPSFGQKAATAYVGAADFGDVVRLTAELARCEEEYFATEYSDVVTQSCVRVPEEKLTELLDGWTARGEFCELSGRVDHDFFLVSLRESLLEEFKRAIRDLSGYSLYTMRPPVHAKAFAGLREKAAEEVLSRFDIGAPAIPVVADSDGALVTTAEAMRTMLLDTFDRAIDWPAVVSALRAQDVTRIHVSGPDNLFRRVDLTVRSFEEVTGADPKSALKSLLRPKFPVNSR